MLAPALFVVSIGGKYASNLCLVFLLVVNMLAPAFLVFLLVVNMLATSVWCFYWW